MTNEHWTVRYFKAFEKKAILVSRIISAILIFASIPFFYLVFRPLGAWLATLASSFNDGWRDDWESWEDD